MRIQGPVLSESARPTTDRAQTVSELTLPTKGVGASVSLSGAARALAGALARALPESLRLHAASLLTEADRAQLAVLSEIVTTQGLEAEQLGNLVTDLAGYRLATLLRANALPRELGAMQPVAHEHAVQGLPGPASLLLELSRVTPQDEALARALLADLVAREPLFADGFVQVLLDPDAPSPRSVDLAFVRRLTVLVARPRFGGAQGELGASEPDVGLQRALTRRAARTTLASAIAALAFPRAELGSATLARVQRGALLLRAQIEHVLSDPRERPWRVLTLLTRNDRALLGALYAANEARGEPPVHVDEIVRALVALRRAELVSSRSDSAAGTRDEAHVHGTASMEPLEDLVHPAAREETPANVRAEPCVTAARYGSATQIAIKAQGAYGSLRSDRPPQLDLGPTRWHAEIALPRAAALLDPTRPSHLGSEPRGVWPPVRPFDIVQALGLSALAITVQQRARRMRARRKRSAAVRAKEELLEAEDLSTSHEGFSAAAERPIRRWESVIERRRRARQRTP